MDETDCVWETWQWWWIRSLSNLLISKSYASYFAKTSSKRNKHTHTKRDSVICGNCRRQLRSVIVLNCSLSSPTPPSSGCCVASLCACRMLVIKRWSHNLLFFNFICQFGWRKKKEGERFARCRTLCSTSSRFCRFCLAWTSDVQSARDTNFASLFWRSSLNSIDFSHCFRSFSLIRFLQSWTSFLVLVPNEVFPCLNMCDTLQKWSG